MYPIYLKKTISIYVSLVTYASFRHSHVLVRGLPPGVKLGLQLRADGREMRVQGLQQQVLGGVAGAGCNLLGRVRDLVGNGKSHWHGVFLSIPLRGQEGDEVGALARRPDLDDVASMSF